MGKLQALRWGWRVLLGLALAGGGVGGAAPLDRVTLQLKWRHQFQFAGYYAAQAKGFYREQGLDVRVVEASPSTDPTQEVIEGRAQYGVGNSGLLLARRDGKPVVVLATLFQHSPMVLLVRPEPGLTSVHGLVGRRIMLEPHSEELLAYLQREGVALASLHLVPHSFDSMDLIQGRVDAMSAYSSDEPYFLDRAGFRHLTFTPRSAGIDFYGDNLFTSEAELKAHPGRVKAFREASLRGWTYAMQHPEEVIDLIRTTYPSALDQDHLRYEAHEMVSLIQPQLVEMGYMYEGRWRHIAETYANLGLLPQGFPLEGFLYDPDAPDRLAQLRLKLALGILLPVGLLLGAGVLVFLRLNRRQQKALEVQRELTAVIQANERQFRFIAEQAGDVIWTLDLATGCFTFVSPSVLQLRGFTPEEMMERPASEFLSPESVTLLRGELLRAAAAWRAGRQAAPRVFEVDQLHKDGHTIPTEVVATVHGSDGTPRSILGISRDITARRQAEAALREEVRALAQRATTDPLTGAWNRRQLEDAVAGEMRRSSRYGHPMTLLLLDIDHFKQVNDTHGHPEGDRVLRTVADLVRACIRLSDSLTRWGGEEFIVLMPNTGLASASILAERIREAIAGHSFEDIGPVSISLGVAEYLAGSPLEAWVARADQALYRAKSLGRNRVEVDVARNPAAPPEDSAEPTFLRLVWSPGYGCGHSMIDAQHQHLFLQANELLEALLANQPAEACLTLVEGTLASVAQHFQDEEAILASLGYPGLAEHREHHAALVAKGQAMKGAYAAGDLPFGRVVQFLAHEVVALHFLKEDRDFFPLVRPPA